MKTAKTKMDSKRRWTLTGGLFGLAAILAYGWLQGTDKKPSESPAEPGQANCWAENKVDNYQFSYKIRSFHERSHQTQGMFDTISKDQVIEISGWLAVQSLAADRIQVGLQPRIYRAMGQELAHPAQYFQQAVEIDYHTDCTIRKLVFDGQMSFKSREILRSIITSSRFDPAALRQIESQLVEDDVFGTIATHYTYSAASKELTKSRRKVLQPVSKGDFRHADFAFLRSEALFSWSESPLSKVWPEKITSHETIRISSRRGEGDLVQEITLNMERSVAPNTVSSRPIAEGRRIEKDPGEGFRGRDRSTVYNENELRRTPAPANLEEAIDAFVAAMQEGDDAKAKKILGAHLLAYPESLKRLEESLLEGEFDSTLAAHIFFLMTRLPLTEAQGLLTRIAGEEDADGYLRMQAIMALGDLRNPSVDARKLLVKISAAGPGERDPSDPMDMGQRLHSAAVLAYGAMASQAADIDPGFEHEAKSNLSDLLEDSPKPEVTATIISAIGNFGHPDFYGVLADHLADGHPAVRMSAAVAFAKMDDPEAESVLIKQLGQDPNADVRRSIAHGLLERNSLEKSSIPTLSAALKSEAEPKTRKVLIDVFGRAAPYHPEAVQVLVEQAEQEMDAMALQRIGQYVPAEKMLLAVKRRGT